MPHTGQRPGTGSYKCESCGETVILSNENASLPFCPGCNYARYTFIGTIDNTEDVMDESGKTGKYREGSNPSEKSVSVKPSDPEQRHLDDKLEEALKETFPASDPVQLSSGRDKKSQPVNDTQARDYNRGQFGRMRSDHRNDKAQKNPSQKKTDRS